MSKRSLFILTVIVFVTVWISFPTKLSNAVHTDVFCAYNSLFVEFEDDGHKWGTMLLDRDGRPIPCDNNVEKKKEKYEPV